MDFHLSEDEAFEDQELDELFNGLEATPGFTIADDALIKDEDLVVLFEQLEDDPIHSPKLSALDIHSAGKNLKESISDDSASKDGNLSPDYQHPNHIREINFNESVESLKVPELQSEIEEEEDIILDDEPVSYYVQLTANTLGITTSETTYAGLLLSRIPACSLKQKLLDFLAQPTPPADTSLVPLGEAQFSDTCSILQSQGFSLQHLQVHTEEEMFGKAPHIFVAMDASGRVQRVIFRSFHGQYAFRNDSPRRGAIWDIVYNAACEMAGVEIQKHTFFQFRAIVNQGRTDSTLKAMVGNVTDHNMWKALQRREGDGVLVITIPRLKELFPRLLAKVPSLVADMEDAVSRGYSPLYAITSHFSRLTVATKTKRRAAEAPLTKEPPVKKKLSACQSKHLASDKHRAAIDKGNATKKGMLESKYQAFIGSYTVRRLLSNRAKGPLTPEAAKALPRIDRIIAWHDAGNGKRLSTDLCQFVVFRSEDAPFGLPWDMDGCGPVPSPDPYLNTDHPAIMIGAKARISKEGRVAISTGALGQNDDEE
ncbi:hypothetical protein CDV31_000620 [Fusarium ambrosium]|uniref:Uncharacterized protein n=1 Tax=Fusarium ambrosium TaxID=131363 RepID=A0A428V1N4_9HYPO|nr:hypothetical protein CDV31_000620 [Fusarium ambrosium]